MILSIIIPVYNIESYLCQCINSLLCDNKNYEIILVDDGSTDNSPQICDDFAQKYEFIHSFHKQNGGVSSARNYGLRKAVGEYIYFVDGDDWIEGFKYIFNYLDGNDLLGIDYKIIYNNTKTIFHHSPKINTIKISKFSSYYEKNFHALWAFIFRKDKIDELALSFNEELKYAEDWAFVVNYLSKCLYIKNIHETTYKYRVNRPNSAMNQKYNTKQIFLYFKAFELISTIKPIKKNKKYHNKEITGCFSYILNIIISNFSILDHKETQNKIREYLNIEIFQISNLKYKCKFLIAYIDIGILYIIRKIKNDILNKIKKSLKYLLRYKYIYYLSKRITKDTTIISTNCFAGRIMQDLKMQYNSPTEGLFFMYPDYIKFLQNLNYYITSAKLTFTNKSKYKLCNENRILSSNFYPIGILDNDIEIHFLHYKNNDEAEKKWKRRSLRVNMNKLFIIGMMQNECTESDVIAFNNLAFNNKIMFTYKDFNLPNCIYIPQYKNDNMVGDPYKDTRIFYKYLVSFMKRKKITFKENE